MKNFPSNLASRDSRAREQTRQSRFIFCLIPKGRVATYPRIFDSCCAFWTFSDHDRT